MTSMRLRPSALFLSALFLVALLSVSAAADNPFPACNDGVDNDGDGLVDYPEDPGCKSAASINEAPDCNDGSDDDGDGLIDFPDDPGCDNPHSKRENPQCSDGADNDGDGRVDFPQDAGCPSLDYFSESAAETATLPLADWLAPLLAALLGMAGVRSLRRRRAAAAMDLAPPGH